MDHKTPVICSQPWIQTCGSFPKIPGFPRLPQFGIHPIGQWLQPV